MTKPWNYAAGPCMLPPEVMEHAQQEFTSFNGMGVGVVELSHRSAEFTAVAKEAEENLRKLLNVPASLHGAPW